VTPSSGNVFADIGIANPGEALVKAKIASVIYDLIKSKDLTQAESAKLLEIDQPRVSDLLCGRLKRFSTDKLFEFLKHLDQDIEIRVKPKSRTRKHAEVRVLAA
jgi:predicted XRE-type DNA-binding protein